MISGIYLLRFKDGSFYIGQSKDINRRYSTHCNKLKQDTHVNSKLLNKYKEHGKPELEIIIECDGNDLDICEAEAMDIYRALDIGLNIAPAAGSFPILLGDSNSQAKYSNTKIIEAMHYLVDNLDQPLKVSAEALNMHYSTIKNIANGTSHKWLREKFPESYVKLIEHKGKRSINTASSKGIEYTIISPEGAVYSVNNITKFAKEHNLNPGALGEVLRGNTAQHKGWTKYIK